MKLFIGNLALDTSEDELKQAAEAFGTVAAVSIALDDKGAAKGFGFVEMASKAEAQAALEGLNGKEIKGQALKVNEARPEKRGVPNRGPAGNLGFGGRPAQNAKGAGKGAGSKGGFQISKSSGHKV